MPYPQKISFRVQLILGLFVLISSGCRFYNTFAVDQELSLNDSANFAGKTFLIYTQSEQNEYVLLSASFSDGVLSGVIDETEEGKHHDLHDRTFARMAEKVHKPLSTIHVFTSIDEIELGQISIPISSIRLIEVHKKDVVTGVAGSTLITTGAIAGFLVIVCNCPQVASYSEGMVQYHGSLFPGAIFKSLKRNDYLIIDDFLLDGHGQLSLRVSNENPEHQFIDQLEVLEVKHPGFSYLGLDNENNLLAYNKMVSPVKAVNGTSDDVMAVLERRDAISYEFNDHHTENKLKELIVTFDRNQFSNNPALLITGQQTQWLDTVASFVFYQGGRFQDNWVKLQDNSSPKKWKQRSRERGLSLNVYLKVNGQWDYVGTHHDVGTKSKRDLLMTLNLEQVESQTIEVKLECAFKIWEVDFIGLTDSWTRDVESNPLEIYSVTTQVGENVLAETGMEDDTYFVQKEIGQYVDLQVQGPTGDAGTSIVLHGAGYYHQVIENDHKANMAFYRKFKKPMGLQHVSQGLFQYLKLHESENEQVSDLSQLSTVTH